MFLQLLSETFFSLEIIKKNMLQHYVFIWEPWALSSFNIKFYQNQTVYNEVVFRVQWWSDCSTWLKIIKTFTAGRQEHRNTFLLHTRYQSFYIHFLTANISIIRWQVRQSDWQERNKGKGNLIRNKSCFTCLSIMIGRRGKCFTRHNSLKHIPRWAVKIWTNIYLNFT
jgi:hypothetical protein